MAKKGKKPQGAGVPGMGAIIHENGVSFRVWAPHAERVAVAGDFNDWSKTANVLASEGNGYWSADVPGAQPGQEYRYLVINGDELWRMDPYARAVTNSVGNSIIFDPSFDWSDGDFKMPHWHELVIYEMHVGTFNVEEPGKPGTFDSAIAKLDYLAGLERGEAPLSRELSAHLLVKFAHLAAALDERAATARANTAPSGAPRDTPAGIELTHRQREILEMVACGLSYKEVGAKLNLSENTIKYHMGETLHRLHLKNREEVAAYALRRGLTKG